jgi:hypothetical protein
MCSGDSIVVYPTVIERGVPFTSLRPELRLGEWAFARLVDVSCRAGSSFDPGEAFSFP